MVCMRELNPVIFSFADICAAEIDVNAMACSTMIGIRNCA